MRNVDRDHGDVRFPILSGHDRRDFLIGLEFDREIHSFTHQKIGTALGNLCAVTVVHANEFDPLGRSRSLQALRDFLGKLVTRALSRVSQSIQSLFPGTNSRLVEVLPQLVYHSTLLKRVKKTKNHGLWQTAACRNFFERQSLTSRVEC